MTAAPRRPLITASNARWIAVIGLLLLLGVVAYLLVFFFRDDEGTQPIAGVTPGEIRANPQAYLGERVIVRGRVQQVIGRQIFTIGDSSLLVVGTIPVTAAPEQPGGMPLAENDIVRVTGTVQLFNIAEYQPVAGEELSEEEVRRFAGDQPAVIAQSLTKIPGEDEDFGGQ